MPREMPGGGSEVGDGPRALVVNGYLLMAWPGFSERFRALREEVERLRAKDPENYRRAPAARLLAAVRDAILRDIPADPGAERYRQGNTLGEEHRRWRRERFFQRFRLFFRYSSDPAIIVYAWLNDDETLRKRGARTDAYAVFRSMLERGRPPSDWEALIRECERWTPGDP